MVRICQQCGDKGWSVALIYCNKCINYAVHRYCLPEIPPTFDEFVNWACEDCKQRMLKNESLNHPMDCETEMNTNQDTCLDAEIIEAIDEKIQYFSLDTQFPKAPDTPIETEVKIRNDAVDSETNMEETKATQTPNSAKKKPKRRRKTVTCGKRKRKSVVNLVAKEGEEPEQVKPSEDAELITNENKTSQTPNSAKKTKKRRKTVTCGTRKRKRKVHVTAKKQEEPEEMNPAEHDEMPNIDDAIDSNSEEFKTSQSPNSASKKSKRKRKTVTCGTRKRKGVVSTTKP